MNFFNFLDYIIYQSGVGEGVMIFRIKDILFPFLVFFLARFTVKALSRLIKKIFKNKNVDSGRSYAFMQIARYVIYTVAILEILDLVGIEFTVIWGGAAALLVGVGLGLQQTFNDLISGVILLLEGAVEVGDIVDVNGTVGIVQKIGIRTSTIKSRDAISLLIPNSKLVGDKATNWSHDKVTTRFHIKVGVAYGSDVQLVTDLLLESARSHSAILNQPSSLVQFKNFGNFSLDFELHFYSNELFRIEIVKSDIRYKIVQLFNENNIEIPFPQQDIWFRNGEVLK